VSGVISGGWEYVWAAYALTGLVLVGYAASLWVRSRP
jgi:heme exporter protein D